MITFEILDNCDLLIVWLKYSLDSSMEKLDLQIEHIDLKMNR